MLRWYGNVLTRCERGVDLILQWEEGVEVRGFRTLAVTCVERVTNPS